MRDKAFNIAKNPKYDEYQKGLASMVYKFFDKKYSGSAIKNEKCLIKNSQKNYTNQSLENFRIKKYSHLLFGGAVLVDIQFISKFKWRNSFFIMCHWYF